MIPEQKTGEFILEYKNGIERICRNGMLIAQNVPEPDFARAVRKMTGNVLLSGLGFGWVAERASSKLDVTSVTVVELHQEVIDMVWPYIQNDKTLVICCDIWDFVANGFDSAYIDISGDFDKKKMQDKLKHIPNLVLYGDQLCQ